MRYWFMLPIALLGSTVTAPAQVSIGIQLPGVSIGINQPVYPDLVPVPGCPVYYAPASPVDYFFYDGLYWVFQGGQWYESTWYNGPWEAVDPYYVPLFILRIPFRYYRHWPDGDRGWRRDDPPHWGERWGHDWEHRRSGWDRWDRGAVPPRAQLPTYQRAYTGRRYPRDVSQQQGLRQQNYHYQPREPIMRGPGPSQRLQAPPAPQRNDPRRPQPEPPRIEQRRPQPEPPRIEQRRPQPEPPRIEQRRPQPEPPRIEPRRSQPEPPRVEQPRPQPERPQAQPAPPQPQGHPQPVPPRGGGRREERRGPGQD
jgi:hypothetical protein